MSWPEDGPFQLLIDSWEEKPNVVSPYMLAVFVYVSQVLGMPGKLQSAKSVDVTEPQMAEVLQALYNDKWPEMTPDSETDFLYQMLYDNSNALYLWVCRGDCDPIVFMAVEKGGYESVK